MQRVEMVKILIENYTLSELEERLELTPGDVEHGLYVYVENNEHDIDQMLREDLFL